MSVKKRFLINTLLFAFFSVFAPRNADGWTHDFYRPACETETQDYTCYTVDGVASPSEKDGLLAPFWQRVPVIRLPDATGRISNRRNVMRAIQDGKKLHIAYNFKDINVLIDESAVTRSDGVEPLSILELNFSAGGETVSCRIGVLNDFSVVTDEGISAAHSGRPEFSDGLRWVLKLSIPLDALPGFSQDKPLLLDKQFPTTGRCGTIEIRLSARRPTPLKEKRLYLMDPPEDPESRVLLAKELGFNAMGGIKLLDYGKKHGIKIYAGPVTASIGARRGSQKILPEEEEFSKIRPRPEGYQYGEAPVNRERGEEVFTQSTPSLFYPAGRENARRHVKNLIDQGVDGISFDYVGYVNYYSDFSEPAQQALERFRNPSIPCQQTAEDRFFEEKLIEAYSDIAHFARSYAAEIGREIKVTGHIYPVFLPNPLYGNRLPMDSAGQTVSWFMFPHREFDKIKAYANYVVKEQDRFFPNAVGAPFIGISLGDGEGVGDPKNKKCAERIRREIEIVKDAGAEAIQIAIIGDINKHEDIKEVIKKLMSP